MVFANSFVRERNAESRSVRKLKISWGNGFSEVQRTTWFSKGNKVLRRESIRKILGRKRRRYKRCRRSPLLRQAQREFSNLEVSISAKRIVFISSLSNFSTQKSIRSRENHRRGYRKQPPFRLQIEYSTLLVRVDRLTPLTALKALYRLDFAEMMASFFKQTPYFTFLHILARCCSYFQHVSKFSLAVSKEKRIFMRQTTYAELSLEAVKDLSRAPCFYFMTIVLFLCVFQHATSYSLLE